jgi:hypothetical protein
LLNPTVVFFAHHHKFHLCLNYFPKVNQFKQGEILAVLLKHQTNLTGKLAFGFIIVMS